MTTLFEPVGLPALGQGRLFWFPTIANTAAPKLSEATKNITCVPDAGWEPTSEQSAASHMKYCSTQETETPGKTKVTGSKLTYEWDPQAPDSTAYPHVTTLAPGTHGYIGHSLGKDATDELAVGDIINQLIPVVMGEQIPVNLDPSNDGQLHQLEQRYFVTGPIIRNVAVVTG